MVRAADKLERHLSFYEAQSDAWRADHDDARACADLGEVIAAALFVYDRIKHIDSEWSEELVAANELPGEGDARAMESLYAKWGAKAAVDLRRAEGLAARGFAIEGLDRFREAYQDGRSILSIPADRVRSALQEARQGRGRPMGEIRDELRRCL